MRDRAAVVEIPADDGVIQRAFEELDAQLDAWMAAVQRTQRRPGQAAKVPAALVSAADEPVRSVLPERLPPSSEPVVADPAMTAPRVVRAEKATKEPAVACAGPLPREADRSAANTAKSAAGRPAEDEQALLAALDEETLKAIKVMRRLNPSQKSLRELIAEYQASQSGRVVEEGKKKSWWKR